MDDYARLDTYADDDLWTIVDYPVADEDRARYQELFRLDALDDLTPDEQDELDALSEVVDRGMTLREIALELLRARGYDVSAYLGG